MANLSYEVLMEHHAALSPRVATFGRMILSGLLVDQAVEVSRVYSRDLVLEPKYTEDDGEWRAMIIGPPA